jgi:hypothetical protein
MGKISRITILFLSVGLLLALVLFAPLFDIPSWGWDISVFRAGSKALMYGTNPYLPESVERFADGAELATIPYYVYSPFFAIMIMPLALLPPWLTIRIWFLVNIVLYILSAILILNSLHWHPSPKRWIILTLALAAFASLRTLLIIGQSGVIMLFFLSLSFWQMKRNHHLIGGGIFSLAFFKPHLILLLPFFALRRRWRFLLGFVLFFALTTLPFWGLLDDWFLSLQNARNENIMYGCYPFSSLNMALQCLLPSQSYSKVLLWVILGLLTLITILLIKDSALVTSQKFDLQLAIVLTFSFLVIDNIRVADLILLIFPFLVALHALRDITGAWKRRIVIGLLMMAYLFPYIALFMQPRSIIWELPVWYAAMPTALYTALGLITIYKYKERGTNPLKPEA